MTKPHKPIASYFRQIILISTMLLAAYLITACTGSATVDTRPQLIRSAEKSLELGVNNYRENNFTKADTHFDRALFLYRNIDNPDGIITSHLNFAKSKLSSGQITSAQHHALQAEAIIKRDGLHSYEARLILIKSSIAIIQNELELARSLLEKILNTKNTGISNSPYSDNITIAALQNRTRIAFLDNNEDAKEWLEQYRNALNRSSLNSGTNQARLLRFEAQLNPESSNRKLQQALSLYRAAASSPGIAATLTQWASHDSATGHHYNAIEKLQRSLFIRSNLQDIINTRKVLQQLSHSYKQLANNIKHQQTIHWLNKLEHDSFNQWEAIKLDLAQPE